MCYADMSIFDNRPEPGMPNFAYKTFILKVWLHNFVGFHRIFCRLLTYRYVCLSLIYLAVDLGGLDLGNRFSMNFTLGVVVRLCSDLPKALKMGQVEDEDLPKRCKNSDIPWK